MSTSNASLPPALGSLKSTFCLWIYLFWTFCVNIIVQNGLLWLTPFTQHNVVKVHPCCSRTRPLATWSVPAVACCFIPFSSKQLYWDTIHLFKAHNSISFSVVKEVGNHHHNQFKNVFITSNFTPLYCQIIFHCIGVPQYLSIHQLVDICTLWILRGMLSWTSEYRFWWGHMFLFLWEWNCWVTWSSPCLPFWGPGRQTMWILSKVSQCVKHMHFHKFLNVLWTLGFSVCRVLNLLTIPYCWESRLFPIFVL